LKSAPVPLPVHAGFQSKKDNDCGTIAHAPSNEDNNWAFFVA
jgi:hypothetical protein